MDFGPEIGGSERREKTGKDHFGQCLTFTIPLAQFYVGGTPAGLAMRQWQPCFRTFIIMAIIGDHVGVVSQVLLVLICAFCGWYGSHV